MFIIKYKYSSQISQIIHVIENNLNIRITVTYTYIQKLFINIILLIHDRK